MTASLATTTLPDRFLAGAVPRGTDIESRLAKAVAKDMMAAIKRLPLYDEESRRILSKDFLGQGFAIEAANRKICNILS